jgi:cytochrome c oxidase assembly protein subunit 15
VQVVWGAFTAGLDAGRIYNTWPLMNGTFIPENALGQGGFLYAVTEHRDAVQFVHRNLAWLVMAGILWFAWTHRDSQRLSRSIHLLSAAVVLQFLLGVLTVLSQVHIALGVVHQFGALLLLAALLNVLHRTGHRPSTGG